MKKKKLSLDALKVKSFVTSFDNKDRETLKGGSARDASEANTCTVHIDILNGIRDGSLACPGPTEDGPKAGCSRRRGGNGGAGNGGTNPETMFDEHCTNVPVDLGL